MTNLKKILLASVASGALLIAAGTTEPRAADFTPPSGYSSWQGFYAGLHFGVADFGLSGSLEGSSADVANVGSPLLGAHLGFNFMLSPDYLAGLEGDIQLATRGTRVELPTSTDASASNPDLMASVRARLGYLVTPNTLLFVTGGVAFSDVRICGHYRDPTGNQDCKNLGIGGVVGAGFETKITDNFSLRGEALHYFFGNTNIDEGPTGGGTGNIDNDVWVARFGASWHFGAPGANVEPAAARGPAPTGFAGPYFGLNVGVADFAVSGIFEDGEGAAPNAVSPLLGAHLGFNFMLAQDFLAGLEGDVALATRGKQIRHNDSSSDQAMSDPDLLASIRARLGFLLTPNALLFVTGGVAFADVRVCSHYDDENQDCKNLGTGGVVGAGFEVKVTDNFSVRGEASHYFFGNLHYGGPDSAPDESSTVKSDVWVARVGGTWHFNIPGL